MCKLESHWYRVSPLTIALFPISLLFYVVVAIRRSLFRLGALPTIRIPVPVIVVGNITVGGTGKTPLVLWLAEFLKEHHFTPGVIGRGYGGENRAPCAVSPDSDPAKVGDEPVLIAKHCNPVWVGHDRGQTAKALLQTNSTCDVLISDDGLQHYALARNVEIALIDGTRGFGNGLMLPAGPLREPASRLQSVDAVVITQGGSVTRIPGAFAMQLVGDQFRNLLNPEVVVSATKFKQRKLVAIAGIANPQRFFEQLHAMGLTFSAHAFPDHHRYRPQDVEFPDADAVLMTEKDAVKCVNFANEKHWALAINAQIDAAFGDLILKKLGAPRGS